MTNEDATALTITTLDIVECFLKDQDYHDAEIELDRTVFVLFSYSYFGTAWDLVKEYRRLFNRYSEQS